MCESERDQATGVTAVPVQSVSRYLSLDIERGGRKRERGRGGQNVMNSHNPQCAIWQLEKCDLTSNITVHHPIMMKHC